MTPEIAPLSHIPRRKPDLNPRELFQELKSNNQNLSYINDSTSEDEMIGIQIETPRKYIFRSNSEIYLKDTDMQDEEDLVMPPPLLIPSAPIMYAEATASDIVPSQTVLVIDQSQMNNLTRQMGQGDSIYVNTGIYQQLQRLFFKAQMTQKAFTLKQSKQPGTQHVQPQQLSTFSLNDSQM